MSVSRSVTFTDDLDDVYERRKTEIGTKRREELKQLKRTRKMFRAMLKAQLLREVEELKYFLNYLAAMGPNDRSDRLRLDPVYTDRLRVVFPDRPGRPDTAALLGALTQELAAFTRDGTCPLLTEQRRRTDMLALREIFMTDGLYTNFDRFLQYLFHLDDETLKGMLVEAGGERDGGLLHIIYRNADQSDLIPNFLRRNLRQDLLQRLDANDGQVPLNENELLNLAGMQRRVAGLEGLEECLIAQRAYSRENAPDDALLTSRSSDRE